jgi:hypothetical protein
MNKTEQEVLFDEFTRKQAAILTKKAHDYAQDDDVLINFKKVSELRGCSEEEPIMLAINTKVVRLNNLVSAKMPMNESLEDTLLDLANYVFLLHSMLK